MPRLKDSNVFQATLAEGSETRDYFGLALGKRDGKYLSLNFGKRPLIHVGDQVQISIDLHAQTTKGYDEGLERTVKENCRTLKFKSYGFEAED